VVTRALALVMAPLERLWALAAVMLVWHVYAVIQGFNRIVLPTPLSVLANIVEEWPLYAPKLALTMTVAIAGLILGAALGALGAIAAWISRIASAFVATSALVVRSVPFVVFIPILSRMMGYNVTMEITIVALLSFFPSFVLVSSGLSALPPSALDVSRAFGATTIKRLIYIALPISLTNLVAALRLSAARVVLGAMVAEFLTGLDGLGSVFLLARADLESERALGAAVIAAAAALILVQVGEALERWMNRRMT